MTASTQPSSQPSLEEQGKPFSALQPIYSALVHEFVIEVPTCPINNDEGVSPSPESVEQAEAWFQQVDAQIQVHQLRQFLQTTPLANEAVLRYLLARHMRKIRNPPVTATRLISCSSSIFRCARPRVSKKPTSTSIMSPRCSSPCWGRSSRNSQSG